MPPIRFVPNTDAPTHLGNFRDVVTADSAPSPGVPFLPDELGAASRLAVEAAWDADLSNPETWHWTDITGDVRFAEEIQIKVGRADEGTQAEYAECHFTLDNSSGNYTPRLATGAYYPNVQRNVPIRVRVNTGTGDHVRFLGYATEYTPDWDESANLATMAITAAGVLRRLAQGDSPRLSSMRRSFDADPVRPVAYWPLEEGSESTTAYDVITGAPSVIGGFIGLVDGNAGAPKFGVADLGPGSAPVVNLAGGWSLDLNLPSVTATGAITLQFSMSFGTTVRSGSSAKSGIRHDPNTNPKHLGWNVFINDSGLIELQVFEADSGFNLLAGPVTLYSAGSENIFDGQPRHFQLDLLASGGTQIVYALYENNILLDTGFHTPSFSGAMNAPPYRSACNSNAGADQECSLGHVAVFTSIDIQGEASSRYEALTGHYGVVLETATDRLERLCREDGVNLDITTSSDIVMGPQPVDSFLNLLRRSETADHGILYDGFGAGLGFVGLNSLYNIDPSLTVDMSLGQVAPPFQPRFDDQRIVNKFTATRENGGSYVFKDSTGPLGTNAVGVYDSSGTFNIDSEAFLPEHAAWVVYLGTVEELRYPNLNLNLRASPELVSAWIDTPLLGRIDVTNVSSRLTQHPPGTVSLLLEGYTETITPLKWTVEANCSPYSPFIVGVLDVSGYVDSSSSTLESAIDTTSTSIPVVVGDGYFWVHSDGDYPITIGGEDMTVTAVGVPVGSTQVLTVTRSTNGIVKSHASGAEVHIRDRDALRPGL